METSHRLWLETGCSPFPESRVPSQTSSYQQAWQPGEQAQLLTTNRRYATRHQENLGDPGHLARQVAKGRTGVLAQL